MMDAEFDTVEEYKNYYRCKSKPKMKNVLLAMHEKPLTPKAMAEAGNYSQPPAIYSLINSLIEKNLILCLNDEDKQYKLYTLTPLGEKVVELIKEEE